jgi:hypothetical protein
MGRLVIDNTVKYNVGVAETAGEYQQKRAARNSGVRG